jgi:predicted DNA-binding transcriptional regulator AlpA
MIHEQSASEPSWRITQSKLSDESLITGRQLREFLGHCSEMHIWRLLNKKEYQTLAFPKPIKINDRNYWRLGTVRQWIRDREVQPQKVSPEGGKPHVAPLGEPRAHVALPVGIRGLGASRKQNRPSNRVGRSRSRHPNCLVKAG